MSVYNYTNVLTNEDISFILNLPEVVEAMNRLDNTHTKIYFTITLTESIKKSIYENVGLDLSSYNTIPMRWIKGETLPHIDYGHHTFENTYLIYLNDSPGELIIGETAFPIVKNTCFVFNEGLRHETKNTENIPRLLLGPMNEFSEPVGSPILYYANQTDALNALNAIGSSGSFTLQEFGGFTRWRIASTSEGTSSQSLVYDVGDTLIADGIYYVYPGAPCFLEGTKILCLIDGKEEYVPV